MIDSNASRLRVSVVAGGRAALVMTATLFALIVVRDGILGRGTFDWRGSTTFAVVFGALSFCIAFALALINLSRRAPAETILAEGQSNVGKTKVLITGFVAMQYYALILNRTFVVFISPEGIYGWKVAGLVAAGPGASRYFEPYKQMLADPSQMPSLEAIRKLSNLPGGFFISRSSIAGVEFNPKPKWGMAGIPHSGRIEVKHTSGRTAEFILLDKVDCETIRHAVLTGSV